jgi:dCMP deaminase
MSRPDKHSYFMEMVRVVAKRATCIRRNVGCILINQRGHVLATGYNGVAAGMPHCNEVITKIVGHHKHDYNMTVTPIVDKTYPNACAGAFAPSGTNLEACCATHAEANALLQCRDVYEIECAYVTAQPCIHCIKLLLNTSCKMIIYDEDYPHSQSKELWHKAGRSMFKFSDISLKVS